LNEDRTRCVYTGRREVLAEASEYYNDETDEYDIPEEIGGQAVWGVKDDCVVAEAVGNCDDNTLTSTAFVKEEIALWLINTSWIEYVSPSDIENAFKCLRASKPHAIPYARPYF
jgi:hypothetical protein